MATWVLVRGLGREQRHWHTFPTALADRLGAPVEAVDLPGFGTESHRRSPATMAAITDDARARVLARVEPPVALLGISLGGMVALDWSARHGDEVVRTVTVNTSTGASPPWERFRPAGLRAVAMTAAGPDTARERATLRLTSNLVGDDPAVLAEHVAWARERRPVRRSVAAQLAASSAFATPASVDVPLLVLASRGDRLVSWRCSERVAEALGAPLRLHDTGGHDLTLDATDWIVDQVAATEP